MGIIIPALYLMDIDMSCQFKSDIKILGIILITGYFEKFMSSSISQSFFLSNPIFPFWKFYYIYKVLFMWYSSQIPK